jgi:hypothetical protein
VESTGMRNEKDEQAFQSSLAAFTEAAHQYIEGLHDAQAKRFALRYMVYLQAKARRLPQSEPGAEPGLSGPDRSLIRIFLRRLYREHVRNARRGKKPPSGPLESAA